MTPGPALRQAGAALDATREAGDALAACNDHGVDMLRLSVLAVLLSCLLSGAALAQPATLADFRFNGTLADSAQSFDPLVPVAETGNGYAIAEIAGIERIVYTFTDGAGLALPLDGLLPHDEYTIAILLRFDQTVSYARILDTKAGSSDVGLYARSEDLYLYNVLAGNTDQFSPNQWHLVVVTRDAAGQYAGYIDGVQQFAGPDAEIGLISDDDVLRFFVDDGGEHPSGAVARIRIYAEALDPADAAALDDSLPPDVFRNGFEQPLN